MSVDIEIERKLLKQVLEEIFKKDERKSTRFLENEIFGKPNKISNATANLVDVGRIRKIRMELEKYSLTMKDYSYLKDGELAKKVDNLIRNKGCKRQRISMAMGKGGGYVSSAITQRKRTSLLNIFEFVNVMGVKKTAATLSADTTNKKVEDKENEVKNIAKENEDNKIIARVGEMYLVDLVKSDNGGNWLLELSFEKEKAADLAEEWLEYKESLGEKTGIKFTRIKRVISFVEEEL